MMWRWLHKLSSPPWFYRISGAIVPWLAVVTFILLLTGSIWGLAFAPADYKQGNSFRIIYFHVPAAMVAMAGYMLMAIARAISLIWRIRLAAVVMKSCASIGAAMTLIALITGAIWGKPTWGTWWVWDARITSVLILFFLYLGMLALYQAFDNITQADKACAVLSIVGCVNVPIIYWSVEWWYSLHQPASIKLTAATTIHPSMFYPLLVMIGGFYCFYALALLLTMRSEILQRECNKRWVIQKTEDR